MMTDLPWSSPLFMSTTFIPTKKFHPWAGDQFVQDIDLNTLVQRGIALASRCYLCCAAYESFQHFVFFFIVASRLIFGAGCDPC